MPPRVEILVHICAPSRGTDDARYRREARGLLEWQTANRIDVVRIEQQDDSEQDREDGRQEGLDLPRPLQHPAQKSSPAGGSFKSSDLAFSSYHTSSSISPEPSKSRMADADASPSPTNVIPPPRTPSISKPARTPARRPPQVLIERTPYPPISEFQQRREGQMHARPHVATSTRTPLRRSHSDSSTWRTPPSVIPDSQPSNDSARSLRSSWGTQIRPDINSPRLTFKRPEPPPPASAPSSGNAPESSSGSRKPQSPSALKGDSNSQEHLRVESAPLASNRKRLPPPISPEPGTKRLRRSSSPSLHRTNSNVPPQSKPPAAPHLTSKSGPPPSTPPPQTSTDSRDSANEIHPPRPLPSRSTVKNSQRNSNSKPHLTPSLATLSQHLPLDRSFCPSLHTRTLDLWERGHWIVPLYRLPPGIGEELWQFLREMIGRGEIGWGCWCAREFTSASSGNSDAYVDRRGQAGNKDCEKGVEQRDEQQPTRHYKSNNNDTAGNKNPVLKMYTWASIVPETWLLLYVGSRRAIKELGREVRWVDAAGETVVEM